MSVHEVVEVGILFLIVSSDARCKSLYRIAKAKIRERLGGATAVPAGRGLIL